MKKIFSHILIYISIFIFFINTVYAADCEPTFNRAYTVEANCTWPGNYKVYGDIIVADKIISIPTGRVIGIDLTHQKVTFTTGRIELSGSAKIDNSVSNRYYQTFSYSSNSGISNCPPGYEVLNMSPSNYQGSSTTFVGSSGNFYCGK